MAVNRVLAFVLTGAMVVGLSAGCTSDESGGAAPTSASTEALSTDTAVASPSPGARAGVPSPGCAVAQPAPGRTDEVVVSGPGDRRYARFVPVGADRDAPAPLVVDLTAYSPATLEEAFSGFTTTAEDGTVKADEEGIVVITPESTNGAGSLRTWNYVGTEGWSDDQTFLRDLLDEVEAENCIDTSRVFLTGFAVGGVFASITACGQTERFAALATVSGLYSPEGCKPAKPLPVISFHGTGDRFIPFEGGIGSGPADLGLTPETIEGLTFMAAREGAMRSSAAWAAHNGCSAGPDESDVADGVTRQTWSGCDDDSAVELYVIDGGEHTWPGSTGMGDVTGILGPVSQEIDATDLIWDFFVAQTS